MFTKYSAHSAIVKTVRMLTRQLMFKTQTNQRLTGHFTCKRCNERRFIPLYGIPIGP